MTPGFEAEGYALLPRFLDRDELARAAALVDAALARPLPAGCERPHNTLVPLRFDDPLVALVASSPRRLERLRAALAAPDLRFVSAYVSVKGPSSGALWWHQDWWCWQHPVSYRRAAAQAAVLCYLGATGTRSGALRLLPGTHHRSLPLHALLPEAHSTAATALGTEHPALADQPDQLTVSARAGDAAALDYRLLHGTHANDAGGRRDCLLLSFTPDWSGLPAALRAHLVRHPALPGGADAPPPAAVAALLPRYRGRPRDLPLRRDAPAAFAAAP